MLWLRAIILQWIISAAVVADVTPPGLQSILETQKAAATDSFQAIQVKVEGVVTWVNPSKENFYYIQDRSGGVQVSFDNGKWPELGHEVIVEGLLERGEFAPAITRAIYVPGRKLELPPAKPASGGGLLNGAYSCERVTVDGWVRSAKIIKPDTLVVVLNSGSARITAQIRGVGSLNPQTILATKIAVRGVATPVKARGGTRQLVDVQILAPGPSHFTRLEIGPKNLWQDPVVPLAQAFSYRPGQTRGDRIHVAGQVIHRTGEMAYLNDGSAGLAVRSPELSSVKLGDWVEAVGFIDIEMFLPLLSDAEIQIKNQPPRDPILPTPRKYGDLLDGLLHADYITITGELIDRMKTPGQGEDAVLVYALRTPEGVFPAEIANLGKNPGSLDYEVGSLLEISGVCLVATDAEGTPSGLKILVPGTSHIRLVQPASWFTVRRLLILLSITLGVLLLAASHAFFSSRRNMRLLAEIGERRAVAAERSRLARDLHDTLEQGLTGIHLQLHSISPTLEDASAETQDRLKSVRSLVLQCHTEMRQSIWNLRPAALEQFDLGDALKRIADSLVLDSAIKVQLRQQRNHVRIPPQIEDNLLRIGQESLTNAVKHARATCLKIELETTPGRVQLTISDNGNSCESLETKPGHFGLVGMRERSTRIGGDLTISRNSDGGCSVHVDVPLLSK